MQEVHRINDGSLDQKVVQLKSKNITFKAQLQTLRRENEKLIDIHCKYKHQEEKISVSIQTDKVRTQTVAT